MNSSYVTTEFFHHITGEHLVTIPDHLAPSLKKGSIVFLTHNDQTKKEYVERINSLASNKWKVVSTNLSVRELLRSITPTPEWPFPTKVSRTVNLEVRVRPYRNWTIGMTSLKRKVKFFEVEMDGRFIRIGRLYVGLGYIFKS
jgi:hypothetical protein